MSAKFSPKPDLICTDTFGKKLSINIGNFTAANIANALKRFADEASTNPANLSLSIFGDVTTKISDESDVQISLKDYLLLQTLYLLNEQIDNLFDPHIQEALLDMNKLVGIPGYQRSNRFMPSYQFNGFSTTQELDTKHMKKVPHILLSSLFEISATDYKNSSQGVKLVHTKIPTSPWTNTALQVATALEKPEVKRTEEDIILLNRWRIWLALANDGHIPLGNSGHEQITHVSRTLNTLKNHNCLTGIPNPEENSTHHFSGSTLPLGPLLAADTFLQPQKRNLVLTQFAQKAEKDLNQLDLATDSSISISQNHLGGEKFGTISLEAFFRRYLIVLDSRYRFQQIEAGVSLDDIRALPFRKINEEFEGFVACGIKEK